MELVNSAISGKRVVLLDGMELYREERYHFSQAACLTTTSSSTG